MIVLLKSSHFLKTWVSSCIITSLKSDWFVAECLFRILVDKKLTTKSFYMFCCMFSFPAKNVGEICPQITLHGFREPNSHRLWQPGLWSTTQIFLDPEMTKRESWTLGFEGPALGEPRFLTQVEGFPVSEFFVDRRWNDVLHLGMLSILVVLNTGYLDDEKKCLPSKEASVDSALTNPSLRLRECNKRMERMWNFNVSIFSLFRMVQFHLASMYFQYEWLYVSNCVYIYLTSNVPLPSNSDHQDDIPNLFPLNMATSAKIYKNLRWVTS